MDVTSQRVYTNPTEATFILSTVLENTLLHYPSQT